MVFTMGQSSRFARPRLDRRARRWILRTRTDGLCSAAFMLTAMRSMALDIAASGSTPMTSVGRRILSKSLQYSVFAVSRDGAVERARSRRGEMRVRECHAAVRASRAV